MGFSYIGANRLGGRHRRMRRQPQVAANFGPRPCGGFRVATLPGRLPERLPSHRRKPGGPDCFRLLWWRNNREWPGSGAAGRRVHHRRDPARGRNRGFPPRGPAATRHGRRTRQVGGAVGRRAFGRAPIRSLGRPVLLPGTELDHGTGLRLLPGRKDRRLGQRRATTGWQRPLSERRGP